ncbi:MULTISPECIES: hypothetical protein [unclassified Ruegeria]|nr:MULTISPECIES: hypothetical protein [unclassified Ruegeria]
MTKALKKSYQGFSLLFMLNRDVLLSFAMTALALAGAAYLAGIYLAGF